MLMLPDFRIRQRDYLLEIARAMTSQLNLDEVLRLILNAATSMLVGEVGLIALRSNNGTFHTRAVIGIGIDAISIFDPLLEDTIVLENNGQESLNYTVLDKKLQRIARELDMRLRQVIALPMIIRDEAVGVIFVFRSYQGQASPNDRMVLQSFADQAAVAVSNAQLYQHVHDEQQRLSAILEYSGDGILILDEVGRILRFNKAIGRMTGWNANEAIGQYHEQVVKFKHIEHGHSLQEALQEGWPNNLSGEPSLDTLYVEGDLDRPDGTILSVGITYAPLWYSDSTLRNIIANVRDITNFRKAQEMKSTFISVISHELKTPVALIKGYAGTLRRQDAQWDQATIQQGLQVIEEEADRLTELINNLLAASKLQVEGLRLESMGDVHLERLAANAVERFRIQTTKHTLVLDFPPNFPCIVGDEMRLRQVIDNLLSNAIKYSPQGGTITVQGTFDAESVTLAVKDQGIGIPQEAQSQLFERFYRVDNAMTRKTQGTGLGLYLARAVIEAHHGRIELDSAPQQGSTFRIVLPRDGNC